MNIQRLDDIKRELFAKGDLYFNTEKLKAYSNINLKVSDDADIDIFLETSKHELNYKFISNKKIRNIKHLITIANLPKEVRYWAYDAIDMSHVDIVSFFGNINYQDIKSAYKNIYIKALVHKVNYKYNPKLDAIHAKSVELELKNGIFYIRPKEAYSYGMYLDKSWLKIDFTQDEEFLTLHLLFDGVLNRDMLKILSAYKIKLPFLQRSGTVSTDLKIEVGLRNIDVDAEGDFYTKKANFDYMGLNIDIYDARIKLDNYDVHVNSMKARYGEIATAKVNVKYNAKKEAGDVKFLFDSINLLGASLNTKSGPLEALYKISPSNDLIKAKKSHWNFKSQPITIDPLSMPFDLNKLTVNIPATVVSVANIGNSFVSGYVDLNTMSTKLDLDILNFKYDGVEFSQSNTPIKVEYDNKLSIYSDNIIHFTVSGSKYRAKRLYIEMKDELLKLKHTSISIGKYITTKVYANYNSSTKKSHISLTNFILKDPNTEKILYKNSKIMLGAKVDEDSILITSQEIGAKFVSKDSGWKLKLNSIGRISSDSELLKKFQINKGDFTLYKNSKEDFTRFKSEIVYPYKILVKNNTPQEKYNIKGKIYKEKVYLDINNDLNVKIKNEITIDMKKSVLNLPEALDALDEISTVSSESNKTLNIIVTADKSYLYVGKDRKILYDSVNMQYYKKIVTAQLKYKEGDAGLHLKDNKFHLYGKNFNDTFMNQLFALSNFSKGDLSFSMSGALNDYLGAIYLKKTTIKDYKTLNNVLAFVNTIPSLVTFSVPGYSKDGIYVNQAYLNFHSQSNKFNLTDIFLDSKEIDILGKGIVDVAKNDLNVTLNLKTDLGSNLKKIPLVGHILLGKDSISTTLKITGEVENPSVESLIAQEIVVAPINIIKRTLSLPYKLIENVIDQATESNNSTK